MRTLGISLLLALASAACTNETPTNPQGSGGTSTSGGSPTVSGGTSAGGFPASGGTPTTGGSATGGKSTGGSGTGGSGIGGKATGGVAMGGSGTGGKATGGVASGGKATGGAASGGKATGGAGGNSHKLSVYIAGDSTVSTYTLDPNNPKSQAGWGQMLQQYYDSSVVTVVNRAVGGMTARHFIQAGNLDAILNVIQSGDYFLVQFGTNDSNTTATYTINGVSYPYFADANTDFKTYLQQYIDGARQHGATPVLVTPPPRNSAYCGGGRSMAGYAQAMLDLGAADQVAVVDLSLKTWTYLNAICPKPTDGSTENFFKVNADNTIDGTHFQQNGATIMARFVADGIGENGLGLAAYRIK
jgi:lysophospholipase L1-like esterase